MRDNYLNKFNNENNSFISNIFFGHIISVTKCSNCSTEFYDFEISYLINFPLLDIQNYIFKNENKNKKILSIEDCFNYLQRTTEKNENLNIGNNFKCVKCGSNNGFSYFKKLYIGPNILAISFNHDKNKDLINVEFKEELNLESIIYKDEINNNKYVNNYKLIGIIGILQSNNNKFIAYYRNLSSNNWFCSDYDSKTIINNFNEKISGKCIPYNLFYQNQETKGK